MGCGVNAVALCPVFRHFFLAAFLSLLYIFSFFIFSFLVECSGTYADSVQ